MLCRAKLAGLISVGAFGLVLGADNTPRRDSKEAASAIPVVAFEPIPVVSDSFASAMSLEELVQLSFARNPKLAQAGMAIEAAEGRKLQASLYPNPVFAVTGDELGDKTGPGGIWTEAVSQEIVLGKKLRLSTSAANALVNATAYEQLAQRFELLANVRQAYFDVLALQNRADILSELVALAEKSVTTTNSLLQAKQVAKLDLLQLEVDLDRIRADHESTQQELPGALQRLASTIGVSELPGPMVNGSLDIPLPDYELKALKDRVALNHPQRTAADMGVEQARYLVRRAKAEPIPNVTVSSGFTRQNQNRSSDWLFGVSLPVPTWNRNQGNIKEACAKLTSAQLEVQRVETELTHRLATACREYASARRRAQRYKDAILPKAEESYRLSMQAYRGGQFEYLRVLQAQRVVYEARLEYNRSLGEAWQAAAKISGLTLEENWPTRQVVNP